MIRNILLTVFMLITLQPVLVAQHYKPVDESSSVKVVIKNLGMATDGIFTGLAGSIVFNSSDLRSSRFSVTIDAASINTDIPLRDSVLRGKNYLEADVNPHIELVSKQITRPNPAGPFQCKAILNLKGISKEVNFPFTVTPKNRDSVLQAALPSTAVILKSHLEVKCSQKR